MDKAAENESGTGAAFINAGLGLGTSLNIGKHISEQLLSNSEITPPPIPSTISYYLVVNGKQKDHIQNKKFVMHWLRTPMYLSC